MYQTRPPRPRGAIRSCIALSLAIALPACAISPFSAPGRFTERGRLLMDGPSATMTPAAVTSSRANTVPVLYQFAILAGEKLDPATTDPVAQQQALSGTIRWGRVAEAGEGYIDGQCHNFVDALDQLERSKRATLAGLNVLQSATVGVLGLAQTAQKTIGIVGIAFGLAGNLFDITVSTVLYDLPAASVASVVQAQRDVLRLHEAAILASIDSQDRATERLNTYILYCSPVTIEANIGKLLASARQVNDREIAAGTLALVSQPPPSRPEPQPSPALVPDDARAAQALRDWVNAPGAGTAERLNRIRRVEQAGRDLDQPDTPVAVLLSRRQSAEEQSLAASIARRLGHAW